MNIDKPLVSVEWLNANLNRKDLILLDCSIPKVTSKLSTSSTEEKTQIKHALFFDIKKNFSDKNSPFPNTVLPQKEFEKKAQNLGINNDSLIICYDDLGIYSSPRVWWMFQLMGFQNIAVLNGGFPEWKKHNYPTEKAQTKILPRGNFKVDYQPERIKFTKDVFSAIKSTNTLITDARSKGRFKGTEPEPRKEIKSGHIPNSVNFPFSKIVDNGMLKSSEELSLIFNEINPDKKEYIFSCGSGITACILALGAEMIGLEKYAVYDGSWTEWGTTSGLPIEK